MFSLDVCGLDLFWGFWCVDWAYLGSLCACFGVILICLGESN